MISKSNYKTREINIDILRIIALLAVISVHCTEMGDSDALPMSNLDRKILVFFDSVVTWQIPIYVMISGRFFLDPKRNVSGRKILKSIWRVIAAFLVWNVVYQAFYILTGTYEGLSWKGILSQALIGPYHFWFLFMIVGLYIITPLLRRIAADRRLSTYYILLFFVFEVLYGYGTMLPGVGSVLSDILAKTNFHFAIGYSGYYVLGYYLYRNKISDRSEKILYIAAAAMLVITSYLTFRSSMIEGTNNEIFTGYLKPNIIIIACAIYVFFVKRVSRIEFRQKTKMIIAKLSEYSFGIYLIHALIIEILNLLGINPMIITPFIMQPVIVLLVFVITAVVVCFVRKIPVVGRKIT